MVGENRACLLRVSRGHAQPEIAPTHPAAYTSGMGPTEDVGMRRFAAGEVVCVFIGATTSQRGVCVPTQQ